METELGFGTEALSQTLKRPVAKGYLEHGSSRLVQILDENGTLVAPAPDLAAEDLRALYSWMLRIRELDTRIMSLQRQGRIGFFVPSTGEEAAQIGTAYALNPEDWVFPAYREQGVALYRGFSVEALLCQLLGNAADGLKGRQMPNHYGSARHRFAVASSPVGTQIPHAVGAAWSARLQHEPWVTVVYFGDGATSTGDFHAGMNTAALRRLPVVFFCKNNGWAISLPTEKQTRVPFLTDKAQGYGMPGIRVDGNDVLAVYDAASEAMAWARAGNGPVFVELITQRMGPHSSADDPTRYRTAQVMDPWKAKDPLLRFRSYLEGRGLWSQADEDQTRSEFGARVLAAMQWAEQQPQPTLDSMFEDVYAELPWHLREQRDQLEG